VTPIHEVQSAAPSSAQSQPPSERSQDPGEPAQESRGQSPSAPQVIGARPEVGGREGPDPTRFGDWELRGRCIDF
jgi:hypothetical protein